MNNATPGTDACHCEVEVVELLLGAIQRSNNLLSLPYGGRHETQANYYVMRLMRASSRSRRRAEPARRTIRTNLSRV